MVNFQIEALKEITEKVADLYVSQIQTAGPLLGVLKIKARITRESSPIMYSPVNAILAEVNFGYWRDLSKHLKSFQEEATQALGKQTYEHWVKNIEELCGDADRLLVLSICCCLRTRCEYWPPHLIPPKVFC